MNIAQAAYLKTPLSIEYFFVFSLGVRLSAFLSEEEVQGDQRQKSLMSFMKKSSPSKRKLRQESTPTVPREPAKEEEEESPTVDDQEDEIIVDEDSRESIDQETRGTDLMESIASAASHKYTCPICSRENVYKNLEEFNQHVDICLNKGAISSLLKTQAASESLIKSSSFIYSQIWTSCSCSDLCCFWTLR